LDLVASKIVFGRIFEAFRRMPQAKIDIVVVVHAGNFHPLPKEDLHGTAREEDHNTKVRFLISSSCSKYCLIDVRYVVGRHWSLSWLRVLLGSFQLLLQDHRLRLLLSKHRRDWLPMNMLRTRPLLIGCSSSSTR
jgi:hypothetical protein